MDFAWTVEQTEFRRAIADFATRELSPGARQRDAESRFDRRLWARCGEMGLFGITVPREYGGLGADAVTLAGVLESLGYGCSDNGLTFSLGAHVLAVTMPLVEAGSEEQKRQYLPRLVDGSCIGANAISEPDAGSDALALRTRAIRDGRGYVLNGTKIFTTNAPVAGLFLVFANVHPKMDKTGITAFLVDGDAPGIRTGPVSEKLGLKTSPMSQVYFEDCQVPASAVLGGEGAGSMLFATAMDWERAFILAPAVGAMSRLLDRAIAYARERQQYGQRIGKFQLVASRIVDMRLRLDTCRLLLYKMAWLKSQGEMSFAEAALTKLHLSESWVQSAQDALQLFGGYGYMEEFELARELRDAVGSRIYSGTSDIQRIIISALLGL